VIELKIRGRGGQGAVVASEMLGRACFIEGRHPQSFSIFGGERRGAPVFGFLRVDNKPILLKCQIQQPDHEIIFDLSLGTEGEAFQELKSGGAILINANIENYKIPEFRDYRLGLIHGAKIAKDAGLETTFNTAVLGAYIRMTGLVKMESLVEAIKRMLPAKVEANIQALKQGYEELKLLAPEETK
jgi:2-oxoacid:acceptor oxidoreductase gamma subunit (pyruvate/2-ketoisovalerate family)